MPLLSSSKVEIGHLHDTTTRILQGFAFLCKLRLLLFKPRFEYERKNVKDSGL